MKTAKSSATTRFIEDAIKGGYDKYALTKGFTLKNYSTVSMPSHLFVELHDESDIHIAAILLDPKSWEAVGKTRGWARRTMYSFSTGKVYSEGVLLYNQHRFIDALAKGESTEEALQAIE